MLALMPLLALLALVCAVAAGAGKAPLWVAVILLCVITLLQVWR